MEEGELEEVLGMKEPRKGGQCNKGVVKERVEMI